MTSDMMDKPTDKGEMEEETETTDPEIGASSDEVMDAEAKVAGEALSGMAGDPPTPTGPISIGKMKSLVDAVNAAIQFVTDGGVPKVVAQFDAAAGSTEAPLPRPVWDVVFVLSEIANAVESSSPGDGAPYVFDPASVASNEGVSAITGQLQQMSRDQKFKDCVVKLAGEAKDAKQAETGPPPPEQSLPTEPPLTA